MVLQFILRRKTTFSVKIRFWTELKTLQRMTFCADAIARAGDNIRVIRSQSTQWKKMNFLTRPDPAFAFVIRDLGTRLKTSQDNRTQRKNKTKQDKTQGKNNRQDTRQDPRQEKILHKTRPWQDWHLWDSCPKTRNFWYQKMAPIIMNSSKAKRVDNKFLII